MKTLRWIAAIGIGVVLIGYRALAQRPLPFAFTLVVENNFGKANEYQLIWRMGTFLRTEPLQSPTKPAPAKYGFNYIHLVPHGIRWTYFKEGFSGRPMAIVDSDLEWWAFWQEVKRKGLNRVIAENHISTEGQKAFTNSEFYSQAVLERRMQYMLDSYNQFPYVPWFPSKNELSTFGKPLREDRLGGVPCIVYAQRRVSHGLVTQTRLWISKKDGMVWQRIIETWPANRPDHIQLVAATRICSSHIVRGFSSSIFELPAGTVVMLPEKVAEYVPDRFGMWRGVRIQHQKGFGIIFNPVTAADIQKHN